MVRVWRNAGLHKSFLAGWLTLMAIRHLLNRPQACEAACPAAASAFASPGSSTIGPLPL
ncbi:hypothetical protein J2W25_000922 [Variovorax boronicumulans]|uniref:Uncharacterized protein n=1 Tax=Variovorax boronicumulans TaxID=436515 RepID=A0AAW8DR52_9BURK|nr:hypothetical protein [Variovorax boronicumulans]MDP9915260.1 hypothetical protein [Variovorax boronicumulans]MDP9921907.1 hypothetical protein [Variovorax boronicumulans]